MSGSYDPAKRADLAAKILAGARESIALDESAHEWFVELFLDLAPSPEQYLAMLDAIVRVARPEQLQRIATAVDEMRRDRELERQGMLGRYIAAGARRATATPGEAG